MTNLYETIRSLCEEQNISAYKLCTELGLSKNLMTELKMGRKKGLNAETASKIANYFDVSVDFLLGKTAERGLKRQTAISDQEIKFALFGGDGEISDEALEEVRAFAQFVKQKYGGEKKL